jgi:hypothetical protein
MKTKSSTNWVYYVIGLIVALSMLTTIKADNNIHKDKIHTIEVDTIPKPIDHLAKH